MVLSPCKRVINISSTMNKDIINYLSENKEKYSKEVLLAELRKSGYTEEDIAEGVVNVFEGKPLAAPVLEEKARPRLFDFRDKKIYVGMGDKWIDFFFGFFATLISLAIMFRILPFWLLVMVGGSLRWYERRRFFSYGIFCTLLIILAVAMIFQWSWRGTGLEEWEANFHWYTDTPTRNLVVLFFGTFALFLGRIFWFKKR